MTIMMIIQYGLTKLKEIADEHGFASDMKAYKANPENFKGECI